MKPWLRCVLEECLRKSAQRSYISATIKRAASPLVTTRWSKVSDNGSAARPAGAADSDEAHARSLNAIQKWFGETPTADEVARALGAIL